MRLIKLLIIIAVLSICSGCSVLYGQYQTPGTPASDADNPPDFSDGQKMLEGRLDSMAKGIAKPGEPVAAETDTKTAQPGVQAPGGTNQVPPMVIDKTKKYFASLKTEVGDIVIEFTADKTPITVNNFISLANSKFYDNTIFHRVISGFMIQGGDPKGDGTGGPGYKFNDEPFDGEYTRGTVAMANSGPNTNGSQFFIMHKDYALPKNYVIFGHVIQGLETVDNIATAPVEASPTGENSKPVKPIKILSVELYEK